MRKQNSVLAVAPIALSLVLATTLMTPFMTSCAPRSTGLEARKEADARFRRTTSLVSYDQAKQAFESGELDKARKELESAIKRSDKEAKYWALLGRVELESKHLEKAVDALTKAIERDPTYAEPYYYRGIVYQRWSDNVKAIADYMKASELDNDRIAYVLAAAELMIAERKLDDARTLLLPKLAYFEHNAAMHELLGDISELSGDAKAAARSYERAMVIDAEAPLIGDKLVAALFGAGEWQKCLEAARRQHEAANKAGDGHRVAISKDVLRHEGRSLVMLGRISEARVIFSDAVREYPEDVAAWRDLASAALALGDLNRAESASERIVALAKDESIGYTIRGLVAERRGDYTKAVRWHRLACQAAPKGIEERVALALALRHDGQMAESIKVLNEALGIEPQSELVKQAMADVNGG